MKEDECAPAPALVGSHLPVHVVKTNMAAVGEMLPAGLQGAYLLLALLTLFLGQVQQSQAWEARGTLWQGFYIHLC